QAMLKIVFRREDSFENVCHPHIDIVRVMGKFFCELFPKQNDLVDMEGIVPEQLPVEFDVVNVLIDCRFERIKNLVETRCRRKTLAYFFTREIRHRFLKLRIKIRSAVVKINSEKISVAGPI